MARALLRAGVPSRALQAMNTACSSVSLGVSSHVRAVFGGARLFQTAPQAPTPFLLKSFGQKDVVGGVLVHNSLISGSFVRGAAGVQQLRGFAIRRGRA
eukprot:233279-Rhodomonas_salina.1